MIEEDKFITVSIEPTSLEIKEGPIYKLLGYSQKAEEEFISDTIKKYIQKSRQLISPTGGYIIKKVTALDIKAGLLTLQDVELHLSRIIASQLKNISSIALFVGTIGNKVEKHSESLFLEGDPFEGYIMNLVGSVAAESVAHLIHEYIKADIEKMNISVTNRFSPGYCEWDVAEQFKLFNYFPFEYCKVSLTSSALMEPVKSVSGIIGIGKDMSIKDYPCKKCSRENCINKNSLQD
jgi:hypothetical protein